MNRLIAGRVLCSAVCLLAWAAAAFAAVRSTRTGSRVDHASRGAAAPRDSSGAPASHAETLKGDREGTVFQSLTVEGEDRVHVAFARPTLELSLDPLSAPGLEWGDARDVLNRTQPDALAPLLGASSSELPAALGRPWLDRFASGAVARFRPQVEGVERWKLVVADSRGAAVRTFEGHGRPPREIAWDGRDANGAPATPGLTYSYVFEAYDRAGNKRNFVGAGFTVPSYRLDTPAGPVLTFGGAELDAGPTSAPGVCPFVLEAASWLDQAPSLTQPLRATVTARSLEQSRAIADRLTRSLGPLLAGDPSRLTSVALVQPDAPEAGTIVVGPASSAGGR